MIKPINHNRMFLKKKSFPIKESDKDTQQLVTDLRDTLRANAAHCVGMAANMIGISKCAIIVSDGPFDLVMLNPVITSKSEPFETEEGCLSLEGVTKTTRYKEITLTYDTPEWEHKESTFTGWTAQIIQHEVDHLSGILI